MAKFKENRAKEGRLRITEEIRQAMFGPTMSECPDLKELEEASSNLEKALAKIPQLESNMGMKVMSKGGKEKNKVNDKKLDESGCQVNDGLGHGLGLSHRDIFDHPWRPHQERWLWISKQSAIEGTGFPAKAEEIRRFGRGARKVHRIGPPQPLQRSFAAVVASPTMNREQKFVDRKRAAGEDWMEEDDHLGIESREVDLRKKLQRNFESKPGANSGRSDGDNTRAGPYGDRSLEPYQRRFGDREQHPRQHHGDAGHGGKEGPGHGNHGVERRIGLGKVTLAEAIGCTRIQGDSAVVGKLNKTEWELGHP